MPPSRRLLHALAVAAALTGTACSGSGSTATSSGSVAPTPATPAVSPSAAPTTAALSPSASPSQSSLGACPAPVTFSSIPPLARESVDVDDAAVTPDGHIWLTAVLSGRILELDSTGRLLRAIDDARGPEGIEPIGGGAFALAEQAANRVVRLDPVTGSTATLVDVPNHTANEGVDGIWYDATRSRLLVPDSANGRLLALRLNADGTAAGPATVLATGLGRPVAAWPEPDGSVDVGVENPPGLVRVAANDGAVTGLVPRGTLAEVDEVVGAGGLLYVTDLTLHVVAAVDPRTGATARLVTGATDPQGLALLSDGRLLLVESTSRELVVVAPCA